VIAVVVLAASAHDNAAGIALLDKVAADTDTVHKALVDQGFKTAVITTALNGGSATRTITDIFGNTVEKRACAGTDPADAAYGAGTGAAYTSTKYKNTLDGKPSTVTGPDGAQWSYVYDLFGRQTSATDPDLGTTTTTSTDLDQTATTTDNRGTELLYGYDVLGRKTDQWQTSKTDANKLAHWDYDTLAKGQLDDSISYVNGTTGSAYTHKAEGRALRSVVTRVDGPTAATSSSMVRAGRREVRWRLWRRLRRGGR